MEQGGRSREGGTADQNLGRKQPLKFSASQPVYVPTCHCLCSQEAVAQPELPAKLGPQGRAQWCMSSPPSGRMTHLLSS